MFKSTDRKLLLLIIIVFLFTRLTKLTGIPVFNDEAIYIHWGGMMVGDPSQSYYSLFDGKQPLMMWLFGYSRYIFSDYLFAGRFVSVIFSALSVWGLLKLAQIYFKDSKLHFLTAGLYLVTPVFLFFDRQALMESALVAVAIWSFYLTLSYLKSGKAVYLIILGAVLGLGMFIKSTAVVYLLLSIVTLIGGSWRRKFSGKKILAVFCVPLAAMVVLLPLIMQPGSIIILQRSDRFNLTVAELVAFPFDVWLINAAALLEVAFWHLTPVVFALVVLGVWVLVRKKVYLPVIWFLGTIIIGVLTARGLNVRYSAALVSLVPLIAIFGYSWLVINGKRVIAASVSFIGSVNLLLVSLMLIFSPLSYFRVMDFVTARHSQKIDYVTGDTAGYGIDEAIVFLNNKSDLSPILVGVRLDAGNPENAILAYYFGSKRVFADYLDRSMFPEDYDFADFKMQYPVYFVSRSQHQGGLEQYLSEEARFYKPESVNYVGVYKFNVPEL